MKRKESGVSGAWQMSLQIMLAMLQILLFQLCLNTTRLVLWFQLIQRNVNLVESKKKEKTFIDENLFMVFSIIKEMNKRSAQEMPDMKPWIEMGSRYGVIAASTVIVPMGIEAMNTYNPPKEPPK
ncbi:hypothetical protein Bhyg_05768 [Pseudolycoriella hygida]|uniref:Transmembrane protein n=1 Tax=Pseudolycoriella hygida TaxID=35572 RepID=A0A9Q0MZI8_9DIPT|nr:hypothetical protein Bhyg_05768 [Pseudolycoriella hygida]